jgi:hypothetical protein
MRIFEIRHMRWLLTAALCASLSLFEALNSASAGS